MPLVTINVIADGANVVARLFSDLEKLMKTVTDLEVAIAKLQTDLANKLTAKDATIADLTAQLAATTADATKIDGLVSTVEAIDATVQP